MIADTERLHMVQHLPAINQNVGRMREAAEELGEISAKLTRLRGGSAKFPSTCELDVSREELLLWGLVLQECMRAMQDLEEAQRVLFNLTEEEQNNSQLPCDFLE